MHLPEYTVLFSKTHLNVNQRERFHPRSTPQTCTETPGCLGVYRCVKLSGCFVLIGHGSISNTDKKQHRRRVMSHHGFVGVSSSLELDGAESIGGAELCVLADRPLLQQAVVLGQPVLLIILTR